MDVCVRTDTTAATAASRQGPVKAVQKLHMSNISWLNIPVIKKIIPSYRSRGINAWDACVYKRTMSRRAESFPRK